MNINDNIPLAEICNECGKSVILGSGLYVNRVLDLNDYDTRLEMGKPFPQGDFLCAVCDEEIRKDEENNP